MTPNAADKLFEAAMDWLRARYRDFTFFTERDVVWTVQMRLRKLCAREKSVLSVRNDHPILRGSRRGLSADLVLLDPFGAIHVAAEFKYEPSHDRTDIHPGKLPVVSWGNDGVAKDIDRIRRFVTEGGVRAAYAVFIDEGRYFRRRNPHPGAQWVDWARDGRPGPSVLRASRHAGEA